MTDDDLISRVHCLYTAISATEETDISRFMPIVACDGKRVRSYYDWRGGRSDEDLDNTVHILIYNIANLRDLLSKWAHQNGKATTKVDDAFENSLALRIMKDLSNNHRHGYDPERRHSHSGKSPRVDNITTVMQMTTGPEKGSTVRLTVDGQGVPRVAGSGTAKVIITGDILDRDNNKIGDLRKTMLEAVEAWESVLDSFDVRL